jgi:mannosyltransferase OCH1-like enzyme
MCEEADTPPADGSMIPKIMHQMWVGPKPAPMSLIQTWRDAHSSWEHILWNEDTLRHYFPQGLYNQSHYDAMPEWNGKCDIARWEILQKFGGFFLDADAICVSPLDEYLLENDSFACYENELMRPGLIAAGYIGASENNALIRLLVNELHAKTIVRSRFFRRPAWKTVGPLFLTKTVHKFKYTNLAVYPSFYFIPRHYTGVEYSGPAKIYAKQLWGSTHASGYEYPE